MTVFYTSDTHFGHERIITLCNRPFSSVDHMNDELITRWNSVVDPEDTVYHLGDVAMGKIADSLPLVGKLNGYKILVPGNHDRCWQGDKKFSDEWVHKYLDAGFAEIHHGFAWAFIAGINIKMSHFPYEGDSQDTDRYVDFRPERKTDADFLVHGHVHEAWQINGRQINVGVDVWDFYPVPHEKLKSIVTVKGAAQYKRPSNQPPTIT